MNRVAPENGTVKFQKNIVTDGFIPDDILLAQISSGNMAAWEVIVDRHLAAVSRYAAYILGDIGQSEDVAQETFIRLMKKAHTWEPGDTTLKGWLFKVARNLCIDHKRKKRPDPIETANDLLDPNDKNECEVTFRSWPPVGVCAICIDKLSYSIQGNYFDLINHYLSPRNSMACGCSVCLRLRRPRARRDSTASTEISSNSAVSAPENPS